MSVLNCRKCKGVTNTVFCRWLPNDDEEQQMFDADLARLDKIECKSAGSDPEEHTPAFECYAKWENNKWVRGCSYDSMPIERKRFIDFAILGIDKILH